MPQEKYKATIYVHEYGNGGKRDEPARHLAAITLKPPLTVYDNQDLRDVLLGPNQEGVDVAPVAADDDATYFHATSVHEDGYKDLEIIRSRIEEFANHPASTMLHLASTDYFPKR